MKNQPAWIKNDLTPRDIAAVNNSGCDSGAYVGAVIYNQAVETMSEHGDDVMEYIEDAGLELRTPEGVSWSQTACHYLSIGVELWCYSQSEVADWENDESDVDEGEV
jgi:hypothetical protein